ncbi:helix-turn-helix domain-containing protein [Streptomyces sp. SYSU K21746]
MPRTFSGHRFRTARRAAGLSIHDVAARAGRSVWALYAYERGAAQPPIPIADALADAVGQPLMELLADDSKAAA